MKAEYLRVLKMIVVNTTDEEDRKWAKEEYARMKHVGVEEE
jgi:hypothetical protein